MPRAKYVITSDDFTHARFYIEKQLRLFGFGLRDNVTLRSAEIELDIAVSSGSKSKLAVQLNGWCEKHLSSKDWNKLKTAIRKRRERWESHANVKTISVSAESHRLLTMLAKRDRVTLSDVLEKYLSEVLNSARRK
jgi:macrodomain Ter protein organizer (MatP/YcbG family)